MPLGAKLADETEDDTTSFLPASAESTEVVKTLDEDFASGETTQGLIVYQREGGLTEADKQKIAADAKALDELSESELPLTRPPLVPFAPGSPPDLVSADEDLAYTVLTVPTDFENQADWGENVRDVVGDGGRRDADPASPATSASPPTPRRSSRSSTPSCCWRRPSSCSSCSARSTAPCSSR